MEIDKTDRRIIEVLKENAKLSLKEISDLVKLSKTPVYERIKKLESAGIIEKYVAVVDNRKLINGMFVFCTVSLDVQKLNEIEHFKEEVRQLPEVQECYLMGGANDFLLKVLVKDLEHYHQFSSGKLAAIKNINQIRSTFVLDVVKKE